MNCSIWPSLKMYSINEDSIGSVSKQSARKNALASAQHRMMDDVCRDRNSFYKDLYQFHESKGCIFLIIVNLTNNTFCSFCSTPIPRLPKLNGHDIDLHKFYCLVIGRGGWSKVNYRNEWEDLVTEFNLPKKCVNASVALKHIYLRYLDKYEKLHYLGEDNERADDPEDDNRHKKWNNKTMNEVPMKYNYSQHSVPGKTISTSDSDLVVEV